MASRRTPGVSQFLATGNALPMEAAPEPTADEWDADLARFTNVDFNTDFDSSDLLFDANSLIDMPHASASVSPRQGRIAPPLHTGMNYITEAEYAYAGASPFEIPTMQTVPENKYSGCRQRSSDKPNSPSPSIAVSPVRQNVLLPQTTYALTATPPNAAKIDNEGVEESARQAAEEDKRRRNTAASARFRVKKKQREQALEKTADQLKSHVSELEARVKTLETENTWLKSLVVVKKEE